jgi:menaquinone reductase, multiheme cytochrome c subunit
MASTTTVSPRIVFPRWMNYLLPLLVVGAMGAAVYFPTLLWVTFSPRATDVGYAPEQPVPYSHAVHVGQLGMDCRYCHTTVEHAGFAAVPPTQTCMTCHTAIKKQVNDENGNTVMNPKLTAVYESWESGKPVEWVKIHDLPDYAYFNHSAHVNKGVGCVTCHGRIDRMEVVYQSQPLNMAWCLDCHREPEKFLRPPSEVTNMNWKPQTNPGESEQQAQLRVGLELKEKLAIKDHNYMTSCSTCHR